MGNNRGQGFAVQSEVEVKGLVGKEKELKW